MAKFKPTLVEQVEQERAFEQEQEELRKKHDIKDEDVVVVEKSTALKVTLSAIGTVIRTIAFIVLIGLAIVGLLSLVYPSTRAELYIIWVGILTQFKSFLPFL